MTMRELWQSIHARKLRHAAFARAAVAPMDLSPESLALEWHRAARQCRLWPLAELRDLCKPVASIDLRGGQLVMIGAPCTSA